MKKLFFLALFAVLFTAISSNSASAQYSITNQKANSYAVKVTFGNAACGMNSTHTVTVPPNSTINVPVPGGLSVIKAEGHYTLPALPCLFKVGNLCSGYTSAVIVFCAGSGGQYSVVYTSTSLVLS